MPASKKSGTPLKRLQEQLQAVDLVFEVRDARLPLTSTHPKANELLGKKPRVIVLCKEDLADGHALRRWIKFLNESQEDRRAIALSLKFDRGQDKLLALATDLCVEKIAARKRKGMLARPARVAVFGLPNVGKSSLINWMIGKKKAAVANTPGVTKGNNWIRVHPEIELMDTPGFLPQVAFKGTPALKLALCNILPGEHYDVEEVAAFGYEQMQELYPDGLSTYQDGSKSKSETKSASSSENSSQEHGSATDRPLPKSHGEASEDSSQSSEPGEEARMPLEEVRMPLEEEYDEFFDPRSLLAPVSCLESVARARACLRAGGQLDIKRAAGIFLSEFRSGKLARVVLDKLESD